ncbi:acetaldehyde dehydrogenase (acetylating) [Aeromicrobium sp. 9AM]|uniref:acetaldehyde dehydrogenase (acetylating) n=1 Tax=Aeromicrobium sp. 9AM TaxID=2653126 RepID=UPI0012F37D48|nr:acetaldehyde dehydrogenase (acetylating) [Aeromicrobium sp. 9AM]VXB07721.1 acetaldehyde-CoA dehydrogenase II, NAD-binding [Aeromicrobium sp. 9AM]
MKVGAVIVGSGNIGTDLMFKIERLSDRLVVAAMVGIDQASDGLARAAKRGIATTAGGIEGLAAMRELTDARVVFDATSAKAHAENARFARDHGLLMVDLTPAALGPYVVPTVNLGQSLHSDNVNMITCGGQATIPIVAAVSRVMPVAYAEIVASIASRSAGPGTRANIDEFTETTSRAIESVGGASVGKAIIILNPAEPAIIMRDTVSCLVEHSAGGDVLRQDAITTSIHDMVAGVQEFVPGYRLKQSLQFDDLHEVFVPALGRHVSGTMVTAFLEVSGAGHYLPEYAGNLDIMTSAALRTAERMLELREVAAR